MIEYFERMERIGYGSFKFETLNKTVAHLSEELYALRMKYIVKMDLYYLPNLKKYVKAFIKYVEKQEVHVDLVKMIQTV